MLLNCQGSKGQPAFQTIKEAKTTCASCTIQEAKKPPALWPSGMPRPRKSLPGWSHSTGNMPKPSKTWRNKSSKRKAEVETDFLSACQADCTCTSPAELKGPLVASYHILIGQAPHILPIHLIYKVPLQQNNCLPQQLLLCQCT